MLRHVDLCSGIGGFALGFEWAGLSRPVMFCDIEPWSRKILAKHWPDVPIQEDVKVLANDARRLVPDCDILTAGYPCQPFSVAGKQKGTEDDRHIWPYIFRIVAQKRPTWCVFENVYGHVALGLDQVLADLEAEGYACRTYIVPACGVDAPHRRDRLWIVAHTNSKGEPDGTINEQRMVGHTEDNGYQRRGEAAGREGQTHQLQQQPSVRSELSRPSEDVAHAEGEQRNERQHEISRKKVGKKGVRGQAGTSGQALAYADSSRQQQSNKEMARQPSKQFDSGGVQSREDVAYASSDKSQGFCEGQIHGQRDIPSQLGRSGEDTQRGRSTQSRLGGMAHGIPSWLDEPTDIPRTVKGVRGRADRLKGLGNAIVPQIAMQIGIAIRQCEAGTTCQ